MTTSQQAEEALGRFLSHKGGGTRTVIVTNPDACPQNHACPAMRYCPAGAITQESIYAAPRIDHELCTECGACSSVCGRVFTQVADGVVVH